MNHNTSNIHHMRDLVEPIEVGGIYNIYIPEVGEKSLHFSIVIWINIRENEAIILCFLYLLYLSGLLFVLLK